MAAGNNRDVTMTIRARDNASASLLTINEALQRVTTSQGGTAAGASDLSAALGTVDKAAGSINAVADRAAAGLAKMQSRIAGSRDELDRLQREASDASRALATLQSPDAIVSAGRDQSGRLAQVAELQRQYERLQREIGRVTATIATEESRIDSSRSALQELGSTAIAAADAQAKLRAQIDAVTDAEERRTAAAERLRRAEEFQRQRQAFFAPRRAAIENGAGFEALAVEDQRQERAEALAAIQRDKDAAEFARQRQASFAPRAAAINNGAGFEALAAEELRLDRAAAALRASLNPVVSIQESFNAKLREANELFRAGKISAAELTKQTGLLQVQMKGASGGKFAAFGLRPYELTNLGYQINDVATQLASGTSLLQTFGQQAGQIVQIFPRVGSAIAGAFTNPAFLGAAAVVGGITVALSRLSAETERQRDFAGLLTANANGLAYQAGELEKVTVAARQIGIATEDATAAIRTFVSAGIASDNLGPFLRTARDVAEVKDG
jgi:Prophage tail length tape measure protein